MHFSGVSADEPLYCPGDGPAQAPQQVPIETYRLITKRCVFTIAGEHELARCPEQIAYQKSTHSYQAEAFKPEVPSNLPGLRTQQI